jgi:hypothetical protein
LRKKGTVITELRSPLKSGHSVALGVLALRAVQPALTLAMPAGGDSPPMGWTPMPDPADGGAGSPPFPVNLTAEERAHLEAFDVLDFELFSRQDRSRPGESHAPTSVSNSPRVRELSDGCLPTRSRLYQDFVQLAGRRRVALILLQFP